MKIETVKLILSIAIALLLGFVCEIIASETDGRNWISFGVGAVTTFSVLMPAMGVKFSNMKRGVSIKVFAWIMVIVLIVANTTFSSFEYRIDIYCTVCFLLATISWAIIYALFSARKD